MSRKSQILFLRYSQNKADSFFSFLLFVQSFSCLCLLEPIRAGGGRKRSVSHPGVTIWWPILPFLVVFRHGHLMWNSTAFSEKRNESRSTRSMQKYQYFEWGSTLNLDGPLSYFIHNMWAVPILKRGIGKTQCKPMRNLGKIQMSPKHFRPPLNSGIHNTVRHQWWGQNMPCVMGESWHPWSRHHWIYTTWWDT